MLLHREAVSVHRSLDDLLVRPSYSQMHVDRTDASCTDDHCNTKLKFNTCRSPGFGQVSTTPSEIILTLDQILDVLHKQRKIKEGGGFGPGFEARGTSDSGFQDLCIQRRPRAQDHGARSRAPSVRAPDPQGPEAPGIRLCCQSHLKRDAKYNGCAQAVSRFQFN